MAKGRADLQTVIATLLVSRAPCGMTKLPRPKADSLTSSWIPPLRRDWIATARQACLAMTGGLKTKRR